MNTQHTKSIPVKVRGDKFTKNRKNNTMLN